MRRALLAVAILSLAAGEGRAAFKVEVTAAPDFASGLTRVAVIAVACHDSVDCTQVEDAAAEELTDRNPAFAIVSPAELPRRSWRSSVSMASSSEAASIAAPTPLGRPSDEGSTRP